MADRVETAPRAGGGSVWYRLGYALERARAPSPPARLRSLAERLDRGPRPDAGNDADRSGRRPARSHRDGGGGGPDAVDALLAAGAGTLVARLLRLWPGRGAPGVLGLARAGLAGASAALLRRVLTPVLEGRHPTLDEETTEALAAGAARGLLYAVVVEPRLPGGPLVRGAVYGAVEYAVSPLGGLGGVLGKHAPHRHVPVLSGLFEGYDPADDSLADHVAFAVALAVLYDALGGDDGAPDGA